MRGGGDGDDWPLRSSSGVSSPVGGRDATEGVAGEKEVGGGGLSGDGDGGVTVSKTKQSLLKTLWEFSRPHTMIGTAVAIPAIGVFAGPPGVLPGRRFFLSMLWAMVPSLLINVYITGLNQITDVEIDKINKPYLPIPAGNLTSRAAKLTVTLCLLAGAVLGLAPCSLGSPGLALTVILSVLIGTVYSLPPFRLKRFPQVAALCILVVRGSIINGGFYSHAQLAGYGLSREKTALWALTLPFRDAKCALALAYFTVFAVVIALMKDVPDVEGDRMFNIPSFSVVLGETKLFAFARRLLTALLWSTAGVLGVGAKAAASASLPLTSGLRGLMSAVALIAGQLVRRRAAGVDPKQPKQVYDFYMDLWKLFYLSYLFLPLAR
ncbi:tocopherol phytyltransferase [Ectocarpus siliculosus]|uniref:Tocopherol phytyltransferase n=1 Tax=Ectocarpus siliculosus TaxID=2880 RepID=D7FTE1_ECTSI|nr:tocopherol phytyltransferase [Ectocarpus siliculosus]|eukprot:CBJ48519.1 tocopherol phytyltransferase [Ectocarpus siliculosus]